MPTRTFAPVPLPQPRAASGEPNPGASMREVLDTSRAGHVLRDVLQTYAEGVATAGGFDHVVISALRVTGQFEVVATNGQAMAGAQGRCVSRQDVEAALSCAELVGGIRYLRADPDCAELLGWGDGSGLPEDLELLIAPLPDEDCVMRGLLMVALPEAPISDGADPREAQVALVTTYAERAGHALARALHNVAGPEQARLSSATRAIVRRASALHDIDEIIAVSRRSLAKGFDALQPWLHVFGLRSRPRATAPDDSAVPLPADLVAVAERGARIAWQRNRVAVISSQHPNDGLFTAGEREALLRFLTSVGVESVAFVPVGAGVECIGALALARGPGAPAWSDVELVAALGVAGDLGRALLNADLHARQREAAEEQRRLVHHKRQLLDTVAHELRTPLSSVAGHLELLDDTLDLGPAARAHVTAMERGIGRIEQMLEDLLTVARTEAAVPDLRRDAVDLVEVARSAQTLIAAQAARKGVELQLTLPDSPVLVDGDAQALEQVGLNLLGNAVKYTPAGGRATLAVGEAEGEVTLTCSDTGVGISPQDQQRLFEEFFRSTDPAVSGEAGIGLGLAIVRRVVTEHAGRIEVDSAVGAGSTFRVLLPASAPAEAPE